MPGTVLGIGMVSMWNHPLTNWVYATPAIILVGYLAQYTALTSRITGTALAQIPLSMEEAAQMAGAGWLRRQVSILVPLARRGLAAAWLVAYIFCLRDLGISMLVYPPGRDTFPVRTFTLMANSPAELISALCVILTVAAILPLGLLAVGGNLALMRIQKEKRWPVLGTVFAKLVIMPAVVVGGLTFLKTDVWVGLLLILQAVVPSAVNLSIIARYYEGIDEDFINQGLLLSHALCLLTIPVFLSGYFYLHPS